MKAIALHTIVPVRSEASETSEQQTQLLFGEVVEVLEQLPRWLFIRNISDGQQGYADRKMLSPLSDEEYTQYSQADFSAKVCVPMAYAVSEGNSQTFPLTASTCLPNYKDGTFDILGSIFHIDPNMVAAQPLALNHENLMTITRFFLNTPYLWGGKNAMGIDCSGFVQVIMSIFGHQLPRNASEQVSYGEEVGFLAEAQAGDLVFFNHEDNQKISHVGILIDNQTVIHSSGRVKLERIDNYGIISELDSKYTHHLASIKCLNPCKRLSNNKNC